MGGRAKEFDNRVLRRLFDPRGKIWVDPALSKCLLTPFGSLFESAVWPCVTLVRSLARGPGPPIVPAFLCCLQCLFILLVLSLSTSIG